MVLDSTLVAALVLLVICVSAFVAITWTNTKDARRHTAMLIQQQELLRTDPDVHRLSQAIHLLHPSARLGFDYHIEHKKGGLPTITEWNSFGEAPSGAELAEALDRVTRIDSTGYAAMRRSEYPSVEDQLDAAFKARHGDPGEQQELDRRIQEIKHKYPRSDSEL